MSGWQQTSCTATAIMVSQLQSHSELPMQIQIELPSLFRRVGDDPVDERAGRRQPNCENQK